MTDCPDCQGTSIGYNGAESSCPYCGGRGFNYAGNEDYDDYPLEDDPCYDETQGSRNGEPGRRGGEISFPPRLAVGEAASNLTYQ